MIISADVSQISYTVVAPIFRHYTDLRYVTSILFEIKAIFPEDPTMKRTARFHASLELSIRATTVEATITFSVSH